MSDNRDTAHVVTGNPEVPDAAGRGRRALVGVGAVAVAVGLAWIAYRVATASVKRHPAVRVARVGLHTARARRGSGDASSN